LPGKALRAELGKFFNENLPVESEKMPEKPVKKLL
jgi:hypothetical protein